MVVLTFYVGMGNQMVQVIPFGGVSDLGYRLRWGSFLVLVCSADLDKVSFSSFSSHLRFYCLMFFHKTFNRIVCVKHPRFEGAVKDLSVSVDKNYLEITSFTFFLFRSPWTLHLPQKRTSFLHSVYRCPVLFHCNAGSSYAPVPRTNGQRGQNSK